MERINQTLTRLDSSTAERKSPATTQNSTALPDGQTAALLGSIIDRARASMGWGRLPEKEHDVAIISWFEILADAGVRPEAYMACYRAAQAHKRELVAQGQPLSIVTPHDLCAEYDKVRRMHAELDKTRLLPENAAGACQRCYGTNREIMPDGSVRDSCSHLPLTADELQAKAQAKADGMAWLREQMKNAKRARPEPQPKIEQVKNVALHCDLCGREVWTLQGWTVGEDCRRLLNYDNEGEPIVCAGQMRAV